MLHNYNVLMKRTWFSKKLMISRPLAPPEANDILWSE